MQEMRNCLECVQGTKEKAVLYLPQVSDRSRTCADKRWTCKRFLRWPTAFLIVTALLVAVSVYGNLAIMAYESRGYFAVGGEGMISIVIGFLAYQILKEREVRSDGEERLF